MFETPSNTPPQTKSPGYGPDTTEFNKIISITILITFSVHFLCFYATIHTFPLNILVSGSLISEAILSRYHLKDLHWRFSLNCFRSATSP